MGIAPTQRKVTAIGMSQSRVKDDKIQETWVVLDALAIRDQLTR
jgi:predicted ester cyclase